MTKFPPAQDTSEDHARFQRRIMLGAVAAAAALGGAGLAWNIYQAPALPEADQFGLWQQEFTTPTGGVLKMSALRGKPLLLNFWATWCPPCVDELPLLNSFYEANAVNGWQVIGIAVDQMEPVRRFLARTPLAFPVAMAGIAGLEMSRAFGNLSGGLPFTVVLGADGRLVQRKMGRVSPDDLRQWARL